MKRIKILHGPGIKLELDPSQIFPEDPGQGTPTLVVHKNGTTSTFDCALLTGTCDETPLTDEQLNWLSAQEAAVNEMFAKHTPGP